MTSGALPAGYVARPPALDDAEAIFGVISAHNTAIIGTPDFTLDDVRDELQEPGFDPINDGFVVFDPSGALVAYGWACRKGESDEIDIDAITVDDAVADWLWDRATGRAAETMSELGHADPKVDIGVYRDDEAQRGRARRFGFAPGTTFHRMRIDHDGVPAEPDGPAGLEVRVGPGDEALLRDAHHVVTEANIGQFGVVARTFDEWHARIESASTHDWSQVRVAYLDGAPVAMLLGSDQFAEDEECGYVQNVAVLESARGRGIARLLLQQAFAADARRGRRGTLLHVDTNNPTPALGLYLSVGMRPVLVIDVWRRTGSAAAP